MSISLNKDQNKTRSEPGDHGMSDSNRYLKCLPWQAAKYDRLVQQQLAGKLSHSLLIVGQEFLGKQHFALSIAGAMLCEAPTEPDATDTVRSSACGQCTGCLLQLAGTHPDFRFLKPEDSKSIKIEQIRDMISWVSQTAQRAGKKVVIIDPAEQMTHQCANALLKCLEEPPGDSLIMLVSSQSGRLLPTIRSRCQLVEFHPPSRDVAVRWLLAQPDFIKGHGKTAEQDAALLVEIAGGAPLAVLERFDEAFLARRKTIIMSVTDLVTGQKSAQQVSELLVKAGAADSLECLCDIVTDCLKYHSGGDTKYIKNKDLVASVEAISGRFDVQGLFRVDEILKTARRELTGVSNPDPVLLIESVMISLKSMVNRRPIS